MHHPHPVIGRFDGVRANPRNQLRSTVVALTAALAVCACGGASGAGDAGASGTTESQSGSAGSPSSGEGGAAGSSGSTSSGEGGAAGSSGSTSSGGSSGEAGSPPGPGMAGSGTSGSAQNGGAPNAGTSGAAGAPTAGGGTSNAGAGGGAGAPPTGQPVDPVRDRLASLLGDYRVTVTGRAGAAQPSATAVLPVMDFSYPGTLSVRGARPGLVNVPSGTQIPGVAPGDVVFGLAEVHNVLDIKLSTTNQASHGTLLMWTEAAAGVPAGSTSLEFPPCDPDLPFSCSPSFIALQSRPTTGSVNLVYFVDGVSGDAARVTVSGVLVDTHQSESVAVNLFGARAVSSLLGTFVEAFAFLPSVTRFELVFEGNQVSGSLQGEGFSTTGLVAPHAAIVANVSGQR